MANDGDTQGGKAMTAYEEGIEAARQCKTDKDNPYNPVTLSHTDWEQGRSDQVAWQEQQQDIRVKP